MSIVFNNVSYTYMPGTPYEQQALREISLEIREGEFIGIIGHTGSGKSTLLQHCNGLLKPTAGEVLVDGVDINAKTAQARAVRRRVGMVFQYPEHQLFEETVFADVAFGPRNLGLPEEEVAKRVAEALAFVGLDYKAVKDRSPFSLSGGQMRRVAIAGVLALKPKYLILDEPSAGLDPRGRDEIFRQIRAWHQTGGVTVILVTHNMEDIARLAERLVVMAKGQVTFAGSPREIFGRQPEILREAGVEVPQMVMLMRQLALRGFPVRTDVLSVEEAKTQILSAIRGRTA